MNNTKATVKLTTLTCIKYTTFFLPLFVVHACLGFLTETFLNDRWSETVYRWTELIA